jgi:dolichyl-phosphate-mannose-protein mannosyltransferase
VNHMSVAGLPARTLGHATLAGIAIGIVYALSPLTVWFAIGIVPIAFLAARGMDPGERRFVIGLLIMAVAMRVVAVAGLFVLTDHSAVPFGSFFGDEEYFIRRALWLCNLALGIPLHGLDLESAFQAYNASSHLYLLALIQMIVGPAPYGLHLVGILFYVLGAVLLFRLVRSTFGRTPALFGLTMLLFIPSLFAWSVSVLKEPLFVLVSSVNVVLAVRLARASSSSSRALMLAALVAVAAILESIRQGGAVLSVLGVLIGLSIGFLAARPRLMLAALVATPILLGAAFSRPEVRLRSYTAIQTAARQHWGDVVVTPGYAYRLLDDRFYPDLNTISDLRFGETLRFVVRAVGAYVAEPLPWKTQSRAALAYLPEQVVWYLLALLVPIGLPFAFRRDPIVTGLLVGHALAIGAAVALIGGNVGTLVRHRGLALPYLVWLSAVGACQLIAFMQKRDAAHSAVPVTRAGR